MKIENNWAGTTIIPETCEEKEVLKRLWEMISETEKGYSPHPNGAVFVKESQNDDKIFVSSGE